MREDARVWVGVTLINFKHCVLNEDPNLLICSRRWVRSPNPTQITGGGWYLGRFWGRAQTRATANASDAGAHCQWPGDRLSAPKMNQGAFFDHECQEMSRMSFRNISTFGNILPWSKKSLKNFLFFSVKKSLPLLRAASVTTQFTQVQLQKLNYHQ
jgi:hypothetical protein